MYSSVNTLASRWDKCRMKLCAEIECLPSNSKFHKYYKNVTEFEIPWLPLNSKFHILNSVFWNSKLILTSVRLSTKISKCWNQQTTNNKKNCPRKPTMALAFTAVWIRITKINIKSKHIIQFIFLRYIDWYNWKCHRLSFRFSIYYYVYFLVWKNDLFYPLSTPKH